MRQAFTSLILFATLITFSVSAFAQSAGDYRTVNAPKSGSGGNWGDLTKWERFDGSTWLAAVSTPTSADGVITISANDSINLTVAVTADQLVIDAGAVLTVNNSFDLTLNNGTGDDLTVNATGTLFLRNLRTISGTGNILVNGIFIWISGTLSAPTTTAVGGILDVRLDFTKTLTTTITNNGTINWSTGPAAVAISLNNGTIINNGTLNEQFQSNSSFAIGGGTNSFINNGTFNKTSSFTFSNSGIPFTNSATGVFQGIGAYIFNFGTITNTGTVSPGNSPGILSIRGGAISGQTSTVNIELVDNDGVAGVDFDQLNLTATAAFPVNLSTVTLTINDPGAPAVPIGSSYVIMTGSGGATFSGASPFASVPANYSVIYGATTVTLNKVGTLPAFWGDYTVISKENSVVVNWSTLQEINTGYFIVEHSTDGQSFKAITTIPAKGNTDLPSSYSFLHKTPNKNTTNYYRLQLVDLDNKKSFSATRLVKFARGEVKPLVITPNPVQTTINLFAQEAIEVRLIDMNGRLLKTQVLSAGNHKMDVSTLGTGVYILNVYKNGEFVESQQVVKQ